MLDSRQYKNGMEKVISNIVLELLSYISETERKKIRQRQAEGIAAAKANGKHLGRPRIEMPDEFDIYYKKWKDGDYTAVETMKFLKLKKSTFYKLVNEYEANKNP